jgi:hydrogenase nickel incorporation protein HypA/HybF
MHEFSIATQILDGVLEFAQFNPTREIVQIRLEIGELMCIEAEQLRFCFDSIKPMTPLKDAVLAIDFLPATVHCPNCQYEGRPKYWEGAHAAGSIPTLQCPECGKAAQAVSGHDCVIKSIQLLDSGLPDAAPSNPINATRASHEYDPFDHITPAEI